MAMNPRPRAKDPVDLYFEILRSSDPDDVLLARLDEVEAKLAASDDSSFTQDREVVDA